MYACCIEQFDKKIMKGSSLAEKNLGLVTKFVLHHMRHHEISLPYSAFDSKFMSSS